MHKSTEKGCRIGILEQYYLSHQGGRLLAENILIIGLVTLIIDLVCLTVSLGVPNHRPCVPDH